MSWNSIDKELQKRLANHKYTYEEAVKLIGCNEKLVRRYMDRKFIIPIKVNDEWYFSQELIDKAIFIKKIGNPLGIDVAAASGLFDYMKEKGCKIDIDRITECIMRY